MEREALAMEITIHYCIILVMFATAGMTLLNFCVAFQKIKRGYSV